MRRALWIAIVGVCVLTLGQGLGAESPARIYVYAPWESPRGSASIFCDGAMVAKLKRGKFFAINVEPGRHMLTVKDSIPVFADVRSGEESFVQLGQIVLEGPSGKSVTPALGVVRPTQARKEIINLVYIEAGKVYSTSVPKDDPSLAWKPELKERRD